MNEAPEKIYVDAKEGLNLCSTDRRLYDTDIEYIRFDLYEKLKEQYELLLNAATGRNVNQRGSV